MKRLHLFLNIIILLISLSILSATYGEAIGGKHIMSIISGAVPLLASMYSIYIIIKLLKDPNFAIQMKYMLNIISFGFIIIILTLLIIAILIFSIEGEGQIGMYFVGFFLFMAEIVAIISLSAVGYLLDKKRIKNNQIL